MNEKAPLFVQMITVVLISIFLVLCVLVVREYRHIHRLNEIESYKILIGHMRTKAPLSADNVSIVQSWMTFRYLEILFNVPPDYFKNALAISDPQYPNVSIGRYAKSQKVSQSDFIVSVQHALIHYLSTQKP